MGETKGSGDRTISGTVFQYMTSEQNDESVRCRIAMKTGIGSFMQVYIP